MANTLQATFDLSLHWLLSEVGDLSSPADEGVRRFLKQFANGTGTGQADTIWHDTRHLAAEASETLDLSSLSQPILGGTLSITFATVRGIMVIQTTPATGALLRIGTAGISNGLDDLFGGAAGSFRIGPADVFALTRQSVGITIDATNKNIKIENEDDGLLGADYDIIIVGTT